MFGISPWLAGPIIAFVYLLFGFLFSCFMFGTTLETIKEAGKSVEDFTGILFLWPFFLCVVLGFIFFETINGFKIIIRVVAKKLANFFTKLSEK